MSPEIRTDRLTLRPAGIADAGALLDLVTASLPELQPWLPWAKSYGPEASVAWCQESIDGRRAGTWFQYSIFADGDRLIGDVTLFPETDPVRGAEIGWWLGTSFVGRGYMTEALRALTRDAVACGFANMFVRVDAGNLRSRRVAERCGFRFESNAIGEGGSSKPGTDDSDIYATFVRPETAWAEFQGGFF